MIIGIMAVLARILLKKWSPKVLNRILHFNVTRLRSTDVIFQLAERTLVKDILPKDGVTNVPGTPSAYAGFDATSDSLHVGNLLVLIALIHWQRAGNQPIVVVGDSTAEIGDPSGHKTDRNILQKDLIHQNAESIVQSVHRIFENHKSYLWSRKKSLLEPKVFRNSSWYNKMMSVDLISNVGRYLRMSEMLSRSSVKSRMESNEGMNFSEFSYQLFQSYDWLHLLDNYHCYFQFGGSDQIGNVVSGFTTISGMRHKTVYGAFLPLIHSETGDKFGKSAGNALYLNADKTSPFDLYQYFVRLPDSQVEKLLKLLTFQALDEVEETIHRHLKNPDSRIGQHKIAEEVLLLVHGREGLESAQRATKMFYKSDLDCLIKMTIDELRQTFPPSSFVKLSFEHGLSLLILTLRAKCFLTEADAVRIIEEGGVHLNLKKTMSPNIVITPGVHVLSNGITLLRIGKRAYYIILWQ